LPPDDQLFKAVYPKEIREVKNMAEERLEQLLRVATNEANDLSNEARVILSSVGLPGSVESFKSGGELPSTLWEKVERIKSLGYA
jgi:hypothetical protein